MISKFSTVLSMILAKLEKATEIFLFKVVKYNFNDISRMHSRESYSKKVFLKESLIIYSVLSGHRLMAGFALTFLDMQQVVD